MIYRTKLLKKLWSKRPKKTDGWRYAKKILNNWVKFGINSIEKVETEELNFKNRNNKTITSTETEEERNKRLEREIKEELKNYDL